MPQLRLWGAAVALCGGLCFAPGVLPAAPKRPAAGQKEQVKKLFEDGMNLYDLRKYDDAIKQFESAFQLYPDPVFLYNIAQAHRMAGRGSEAIGFYKTYLRKLPEAKNAGEIKGWIAELEKGGPPAAPPPPAIPPPPPAQPFLEPQSKYSFMTRINFDNKGYALTGVSHRSYKGFLLYGIGLFIEEEPARRTYPKLVEKAGGSDPAQLRARDLAQNFILLGEFGKVAVLHFARDLTAAKIRDSYRDLFKANLKSDAAPALRQHTEEFLALFARDMKGGEDMMIHTTADGHINIISAGDKKTGPQDQTLCIDLWSLWLGPKSISEELKQGLVERVQALGQSVPVPSPGR